MEVEASTPDELQEESSTPAFPQPGPKGPKAPKAAKRYIKSAVTVHDRTQIETVFDYFLHRRTGATVKNRPEQAKVAPRALEYRVEAFLFYPRQFGLDQNTYPKERFFQDMRPLLRFREPKLGFKTMMGQKPGATSPLTFLRDSVAALADGRSIEPTQNALDEVRLFACGFVSGMLRGIDRGRRRLDRLRAVPDAITPEERTRIFVRLTRQLEKTERVVAEYRHVLDAANKLPEGTGVELVSELRLIDEYCYYRMRDGIAYLLLMTADFRGPDGIPEARQFGDLVNVVLRSLDAHAATCGYMQIRPDSTESQKEKFVHRRGELKRRIWAVLFLEIRAKPLFALQRQIGAMFAAGLAALFYGVAQLLLVLQVVQPHAVRDVVGLSGMLFISATALAYIVKDRIKEFGRSKFGGGVFHKIPDHSETIYYNDRLGKQVPVGSIQEAASYLKLEHLPERVQSLRTAYCFGQMTEDESIEHVLKYTKTIKLSSSLKILGRYPLRAVHDILRLNIDACLPRLGEPVRMLNVVDNGGTVHEVEFPKVYYLDMALSYSKQGESGFVEEQALDYFRLVIDKNGLLRIERLG